MLADITELAQGIYEIMDEDAKALMAFGMVDKKYLDSLENNTKRRLKELADDQGQTLDVEKEDKFVKELVDAVSKKLYSVADMVV